MSKIIAIINQKGGVSKTTTTLSLSAALSMKGYKVLAIDIDGQANLSQSFDLNGDVNTFYHLIKGECSFKPIEIINNLFVIPSSTDVNALEVELAAEPGREFLLKGVLESNIADYDFVFLDCSPSLGLTSINALTCADSFLIPVEPHPLSIIGLTSLLKTTDKIKKKIKQKPCS